MAGVRGWGRVVSLPAILWAMYEAPVPTNPTEKCVLMVLAEHADPKGSERVSVVGSNRQDRRRLHPDDRLDPVVAADEGPDPERRSGDR